MSLSKVKQQNCRSHCDGHGRERSKKKDTLQHQRPSRLRFIYSSPFAIIQCAFDLILHSQNRLVTLACHVLCMQDSLLIAHCTQVPPLCGHCTINSKVLCLKGRCDGGLEMERTEAYHSIVWRIEKQILPCKAVLCADFEAQHFNHLPTCVLYLNTHSRDSLDIPCLEEACACVHDVGSYHVMVYGPILYGLWNQVICVLWLLQIWYMSEKASRIEVHRHLRPWASSYHQQESPPKIDAVMLVKAIQVVAIVIVCNKEWSQLQSCFITGSSALAWRQLTCT